MAGEMALPVLPFEDATRKVRNPMSTLTYAPGAGGVQRVQADIPPSGLLARLYCHVTATNTIVLGGGTAALDWSGPWSSITKIRTVSPGGLEQFSLSGFAAYLQNTIERYSFVPEEARVTAAPSHFAARVYTAGVASGANTWEFGFVIPVALNEREAIGLLLMQNSSSAFQLVFEYISAMYSTTAGQAPVLVTGAATAAISGGTITVVPETFTVPDDPGVPLPPADYAHTYREYYKAIASVGADLDVPLTDQHRFISILHHVVMNNQPNSADVDFLKLQYSSSFVPYIVPNRVQLELQHKAYGRALPNGVFVHDFMNQGLVNYGTARDWVDGSRVSDLRSFLTVASTATLGTNASRVLTITRQLQKVVASPSMSSRG